MNNTNYPQLATQYGTPLYVYHQAALTAAFAAYQTAFSGCQPLVCYAVKANGNLSVIRHFAQLGSGFDTVSAGEIARVLAAGGEAGKIIFVHKVTTGVIRRVYIDHLNLAHISLLQELEHL